MAFQARAGQEIFSSFFTGDRDALLTVKANGGRLDVEYPVGSDWVIGQTIALDTAILFDNRNQVRITPTGGATYDVIKNG